MGVRHGNSNVSRITRIRCVIGYQTASQRGFINFEDGIMSTRRKAYWWFWFVASGRFLETFLNLRGKRR
jgi:hypothetical protein